MSQYNRNDLVARVVDQIKANDNREITGDLLQDILIDIIDSAQLLSETSSTVAIFTITNSDLIGLSKTLNHSDLDSENPDWIVYIDGVLVHEPHFTISTVDSLNHTITFQEELTGTAKVIAVIP